MTWTRSPAARAIAFLCAVALVALYWDDRNGFFWLGVILLVVGVVRLVAVRATQAGHRSSAFVADPRSTGEAPTHRSWLLVELLEVPAVAKALSEGPETWRQVAYFDDDFDPAPPGELAEFIWIQHDDDWSVAVGDELKPYLDLDIPAEDDAIVRVLGAHPEVTDARHENREVYEVESRGQFDVATFAGLALRALTAGQLAAASRIDPEA